MSRWCIAVSWALKESKRELNSDYKFREIPSDDGFWNWNISRSNGTTDIVPFSRIIRDKILYWVQPRDRLRGRDLPLEAEVASLITRFLVDCLLPGTISLNISGIVNHYDHTLHTCQLSGLGTWVDARIILLTRLVSSQTFWPNCVPNRSFLQIMHSLCSVERIRWGHKDLLR